MGEEVSTRMLMYYLCSFLSQRWSREEDSRPDNTDINKVVYKSLKIRIMKRSIENIYQRLRIVPSGVRVRSYTRKMVVHLPHVNPEYLRCGRKVRLCWKNCRRGILDL